MHQLSMQHHISILATQQIMTPMQRVEGEMASLTTLYNFMPLDYMVLIIKNKQKK